MLDRLRAPFRRLLLRFDVAVLVATSALLVAVLIFVKTVDEVSEGDADVVDRRIVEFVKSIHAPPWFNEFMRDCSAFGGTFVLGLITLVVGGYFAARRLYTALVFLMTSVLGAAAISSLLKSFFRRDRPTIIEHGSYVASSSFPSGHSMLSAAVWLTLGVMIARFERSPYLKAYFILVALFVSFMVGVSRVWLGVHWPTDVLAGWTGGFIWAVASWFLARYLQHRGTIERDDRV